MIKPILFGGSAIAIVLLGAVFILPGLVPTDTYRDKLESDLSRVFARDVQITGDIKLKTFPILQIETGAISLANPQDFTDGRFVDLDAMSAKVRLWPLLKKRVEISAVTLQSPMIRLEKRADGRTNWQTEKSDAEPIEDPGPFKRDGRYTEYDPSLALLKIENGFLEYIDGVENQTYTIDKINIDLRAPGLDQKLSLKGDLAFDGLAANLNAEINSPADFLNGTETGFSAEVETTEARFDITGEFLASQDIALTAGFETSSQSPNALAAHLPLPEDINLPSLSSIDARGQLSYGPETTNFPKLELAVEGAGINASFNGNFDLAEGATNAGTFSANLTDFTLLDPYVEEPIEALKALSSVTADGSVKWSGKSATLTDIKSALEGPDVKANFNGNASFDSTLAVNGQFDGQAQNIPTLIQTAGLSPIEALNVVSSAAASGNVNWSGEKGSFSNLKTTVDGSHLKASFEGTVSYDTELGLNGQFEGQTEDFAALLEMAGTPQEDAAALERLKATGQIAILGETTTLSNVTAEATDGYLNGKFLGGVTYKDALGLDGEFTGELPDLAALDAALPRDIPYSDVAKRIKISSKIKSQAENFTLTNLSAELSEGRLNGDFIGQLSLGKASDLSGDLSLSAASLRDIAATQDVLLPASTDVGAIFENFALSGKVTGTPEKIVFNSGTVNLDKLSGRGDFTLTMNAVKPVLGGALSLSELDLRPYMAAWSEQNPTGQILPWSEDPISLTGLESVDAVIDISTPSILLDRLKIGATDGVVNLRNGTLTADLRNTELYGGNAAGTFAIKSVNGVPRVDIDAKIKSVAAQDFFMASGGFDKVTGSSDISLNFTGQGKSQADIMKTLTGGGIFQILNGQLQGIDAGTLLSGVDTALAQRQLPQGLGLGQTTSFNDIDSRFSLTNGRAVLSGFELKSGAFFMEADGVIDIGQQTIDIGLRPKLTNGSDLAQFGIPIRFRGGFGQTKPSLDTGVLTEIAAAKARQKAGNAVRDRVGGTLGGILGGVIGADTPSSPSAPVEETPAATDQSTAPTTGASPSAASPESFTNTQAQNPEPESTEEQIENALKGLFGRKKKN